MDATPLPSHAQAGKAESIFDSLEEERDYHARKINQYKNALSAQITEVKTDAEAIGKKSLMYAGAAVGGFLLMRLLAGKKTQIVKTLAGPVEIKRKESLLATALKTAALVGLGYLAKDSVLAAVERLAQDDGPTDDPDADYEPPIG